MKANTELEQRLEKVEGITANVEKRITEFESEVLSLATDIDTNSKSINNIESDANICIDDFELFSGKYCGNLPGAMLKKLPLWGEKVSDSEIDFEWPNQETFEQMRPDVSIDSIEFKTMRKNSFYVSSVKVNLSNGRSSPVFENSNWTQHNDHQTINFDT